MSTISHRLTSVLLLCLIAVLLPVLSVPAHAEASCSAADISGIELISDSDGFVWLDSLFDGNIFQGFSTDSSGWLTLEHPAGIGSVYIIFDELYGEYTVTDNGSGVSHTVNQDPYLHQFVDLHAIFGTAPTSVTLSFSHGSVRIFEIQAFSPGEVPDSVQKWEPPLDGGADLVLFSTHGDDEQLFFAGLLPYYAGELDYRVQVVYFTNHRTEEPHRVHEMLNGLWAVGGRSLSHLGKQAGFFPAKQNGRHLCVF